MEKRYWHSCIGYGIQTKCGSKYAAGRIEVYDTKNKSGFAIDEYSYWVPIEIEDKWRNFWDSLETDLPMFVDGGKTIQNITYRKIKQLNNVGREI